MGSFNLADMVTGESVQRGDRIVAFLVHDDITEYAHRDNPNQAACDATARYKFVSLPMYGVYDDYGNFKSSSPKGTAMKMALRMTGLTDPDELIPKSVGFDSKVQLLGKENHEPRFLDSGEYTRTYGLAVVHESTFAHMVATQGTEAEQEAEVNAIFTLLEKGENALESTRLNGRPEDPATRNHLFSLSEACSLIEKTVYLDASDVRQEAPMLSNGINRDTFHPDFYAVVRDMGLNSLMHRDPRKEGDEDGPYRRWTFFREYLAALWEIRCFIRALDHAGRELSTSRTIGQYDNSDYVLALQVNSAIESLKRQLPDAGRGKERKKLQERINALYEVKNQILAT